MRLFKCVRVRECEKKSESKKLVRAQERETSRQIDDFVSSIVVVFISLNSLRFYFSFLVSHSHEIEKLSGKTNADG